MKIKITGLDELYDMYKKAPAATLQAAHDVLNESGATITSNVVKKMRDKDINDTGKAAQSVRNYPLGKLRHIVEATAKYFGAIEEGSRPHIVPLKALKAYAKRKLGSEKKAIFIQRSIAKKGTKGKYPFKEGLEDSMRTVESLFNSIFDRVFK
jgi:hypothetical protein